MASPHTAGLATLLFSVLTDCNGDGKVNDEVRSGIEGSCDDLGVSGIGHGRINAFKAVGGSTVSPGAISGKVTDSGNGTPVVGATVSDTIRTAFTDASGNYTISNVLPGSYTVTASASGYTSSSQTASVVAGQTTAADFTLVKPAPPVIKAMWVDSITFRPNGKSLRFDVRVVADSGAVAGAEVTAKLAHSSGQSWTFRGMTDSLGITSFVVAKAPAGNYVATITGLTASGYTWDASRGVISTSYTFSNRR
jgi:hypothetical protein